MSYFLFLEYLLCTFCTLPCVVFTFNQLTLAPEMHFVRFLPEVASCVTLHRQKKVCNPGDEAMIKVHTKLFVGVPLNFTFSVMYLKLQGVWRQNFRFAIITNYSIFFEGATLTVPNSANLAFLFFKIQMRKDF